MSAAASADLHAAFLFINRDNPRAARKMRSAIRRTILSLRELPDRGRPSGLPGLRELLVAAAPYVVVYAVDEDGVTVVRIRHTSQRPTA